MSFESYCTQIGFYFLLKSKRISVQNHAVIKRLVQFRSLLHQLETSGKHLQPEIDGLLSMVKTKQSVSPSEFLVRGPPRKKLRILSKPTANNKNKAETAQTNSAVVAKKGPAAKKKEMLTKDEQGALEFYSAINKRKADDDDEEDETVEDVSKEEEAKADEGEEPMGKRAINYQIAKNKGLTPHRQKEQRNPRVKHRMKFRQANIRRKGAVSWK